MQLLRAATQDILKRIETLSGKSVQLMRDDSLSVLAFLQMARHGAGFHVLADGGRHGREVGASRPWHTARA